MLTHQFFSAHESDSRWLLVALHGLGDSTQGYEWLPGQLRLPWLNCLLVNAPDPYYTGFSWFDFTGDPRPGITRSRTLLFEMLERQQQEGFSCAQTFLFGFSQGCLMCYEVGLRYPQRLAGLVGISGWHYDPAQLLREQSPVARHQHFLVTHGQLDSLVPFDEARNTVQALQTGGISIQWHEFPKAHTIAGELEMRVVRQFLEARRLA